ncbi:MAG: VTT domain-containing protein [Streptococcaceae bacterium]|nr:VTT domain-containing protein [Streptococcaceae bacterium]MCH4176269.1 VTT domain-containing protein [Streptococcaceae bacterium]
MNYTIAKKVVNVLSMLGIAASFLLVFYFYRLGVFSDQTVLAHLVDNRVILGPIIFILIQIIQVVIPIIPGGVSTVAGVLIFGPVKGFIYNYVGIVIGSIILFYLGRTFGRDFIQLFVSEKTFNKYVGWLDKGKKWDIFFFVMMISPIAPDDALVLMASLTKMSQKSFLFSIFVGKPLPIFLYSYALLYGGQILQSIFF